MEKKAENLKAFSIGFLPHILVFGAFAVCIFRQPDFGSILILAVLTWLMMFVGGVPCRHLFTSLIALLPVAGILFVGAGVLGAGTLKDLALALFVGIAAGTYSSIFVATPLFLDWHLWADRRKAEAPGEAKAESLGA